MTQNNFISPLPFYTALGYQNHRKPYNFGGVFCLMCEANTILPFQFVRDSSDETISSVIIHNLNTGDETDISDEMVSTGLEIVTFDDYDVIKYSSTAAITTPDFGVGRFYLEINEGSNTWYSEVFTFVSSVENCLKIQWWDVENWAYNDLGEFDYNDDFKFLLNLQAELGYPEYEFTEEAEDNDGYTIIEKQISEKTFRSKFIAPEYMCDALQIPQMADYVLITYRGREYYAETISFDIDWENGGALASVEMSFQLANPLKKIGQGYEVVAEINPPYTTSKANQAGRLVGNTSIITGFADGELDDDLLLYGSFPALVYVINDNTITFSGVGQAIITSLELSNGVLIDFATGGAFGKAVAEETNLYEIENDQGASNSDDALYLQHSYGGAHDSDNSLYIVNNASGEAQISVD